MSALARLLEQAAQPFPWIVVQDGYVISICTDDGEHEIVPWNDGAEQVAPEHARLIALAPDMARLLIDMADALNLVLRDEPGDWDAFLDGNPTGLLARFAELEQRAAP